MLKFVFITLPSFFIFVFSLQAQTNEKLSPLQVNVELQKNQLRSFPGIFVYEIDTITLPLVDDFSTNKFRQYNAQPGDANVTTQLYYLLLNGAVPFPAGTGFSSAVTQHIIVDTTAAGADTIYFVDNPSQIITVNDLTQYPVVGTSTTVYPCYNIIDTAYLVSDMPDTVAVTCDLIQDSVNVYFVSSIDTLSAIWLDNFAYRNFHYSDHPPTIGVATFDGFSEVGYPYDFSLPTNTGICDYLTSKPIDLSGTSPLDSLYLSFYYQPEGVGEAPATADSLVLEFYSPTTVFWEHVWTASGEALQPFQQVMIPITKAAYFSNAFQFRFKNYGNTSGSVDHWHLDYVYLSQFRTAGDTNRNDVAFTYQANTLLNNRYTSMPLTHFETDPAGFMCDTITTFSRNNSIAPKLMSNYGMNVSHEGTTIFNVNLNPYAPSIGALTNFKTLFHTDTLGVLYDTSLVDSCAEVFDVWFTHRTTPDDIRENDTMHFSQTFSNYYAYDDGTAERGYGPIGAGAKLGYGFTLAKPDNLFGIAIHFTPSIDNVDAKTFFLTVWDNAGAGGSPGNIIYQETVLSDVVYENAHNKFHVYPFSTPIAVSGTIYIGWQQVSLDQLNIGFDVNNNNQSKIYYNTGFAWANTSFSGSLLMRPVFDVCETSVVSVAEEVEVTNEVKLFPNPATDNVTIESNEQIEQISVFDISGKHLVGFSKTNNFNVRELATGIYLVHISTKAGSTTHRLVKE
jgi:Secretion system C-terminal sorting domain